MKRKFYVDVWGILTEATSLYPVMWPPTSEPGHDHTRYTFEVEFPDLEATELPSVVAKKEEE